MENEHFYTELPSIDIDIAKLFLRPHLFYSVPADWHVIITDVENSSEAVAAGMHQDINLIATASIVAVLNITYDQAIEIPFFFGGDGATFLVPNSALAPAIASLKVHQENTQNQFGHHMRVGHMTVKKILEKGFTLKVSKVKSNENFSIPIVLGDGLAYAEQIIKGEQYELSPLNPLATNLNLEGMECRWDLIDPPDDHEEIISLLAVATTEEKQAAAFSKVLAMLDKIFGDKNERKPISLPKLKLLASAKRIKQGMRLKMRKSMTYSVISEWFTIIAAKLFLKTNRGKKYLKSLIEMTDNLVIDGKINTVISGTVAQRKEMQEALAKMEADGEIIYGCYCSAASVMSCYVRDLEQKHIHFVDGANGGYTQAARSMKKKMAERLG